MTDKQSEALRIAEELLALFGPTEIDERAADELRRLHEMSEDMSELLKITSAMLEMCLPLLSNSSVQKLALEQIEENKAALAKAEGK